MKSQPGFRNFGETWLDGESPIFGLRICTMRMLPARLLISIEKWYGDRKTAEENLKLPSTLRILDCLPARVKNIRRRLTPFAIFPHPRR